VRACVRASVRACVRACVSACVCVCVFVYVCARTYVLDSRLKHLHVSASAIMGSFRSLSRLP